MPEKLIPKSGDILRHYTKRCKVPKPGTDDVKVSYSSVPKIMLKRASFWYINLTVNWENYIITINAIFMR